MMPGTQTKMRQKAPGGRSVALSLGVICLAAAIPSFARKHDQTAITVDGRPIRKVYIHADSPDIVSAASAQLIQDTCLTAVPNPKQADAVLDLGIALPSVGGGLPQPDIFGSSPHAQTMGNLNKPPQRSVSANCSDSKGNGGCTSSYTAPAGSVSVQPSAEWAGNMDTTANLDVSLASPGNASQELWEQNEHSKKSWSDQLRVAAGCPVCPGRHFDRHRYKTYRDWIQSECPSVLAGTQ